MVGDRSLVFRRKSLEQPLALVARSFQPVTNCVMHLNCVASGVRFRPQPLDQVAGELG
jgi:hypothetical protein